jgi:hypothetical protein
MPSGCKSNWLSAMLRLPRLKPKAQSSEQVFIRFFVD